MRRATVQELLENLIDNHSLLEDVDLDVMIKMQELLWAMSVDREYAPLDFQGEVNG